MPAFLDEVTKAPKKGLSIPTIPFNKPIISFNQLGPIGLELELEGRNLPQGANIAEYRAKSSKAGWTVHRDGSLRNGGLEYVLTTPCFKDELDGLLSFLWDLIYNTPNARVEHSNRTSTHVHINISGMKANELTSFLVLWGLFEPALINWCGEQRTSNNFCLSTKDTSGWLPNAWRRALEEGYFNWDNANKYSALNIGSFNSLGSFEFRCMAGANTPTEVINWASLLYGLRNAAKTQYRFPDILGYAVSEMGPEGILRGIGDTLGLEQFVAEIIDGFPSFNEKCLENFRDYQELCFFFPWSNLSEEIDLVYYENPFTKKPSQPMRNRAPRQETVPQPAADIPAEVRNMEALLNGLNRREIRPIGAGPRDWNAILDEVAVNPPARGE